MAQPIKRVENYTKPALVMIFVNLLWLFGVLLAIWGLPAVLLAGWILNHAITRLERRFRAQGRYP
ncbi:histidinol phosphate aminotransferase [Shimia thalassica]|uniref:histidinol phosphate aminotransferase n=1 Tax=Shimia thalassica TaxID=1715693 RepID=UPI0026E1D02E|nr:histidinol phosphate aminotransferase [Shimia thalassica]MDO6520551.1 histidinol phosphate aminotransferase [Shimia thalassica]